MAEHVWDRSAENLGNIVSLEHVNTCVAEQRLATIFYITAMGFTRDPYLSPGVGNMWINIGRSQFHLPTGKPQVVRGHIGLVLPSRGALLDRLTGVKAELDGTQFTFIEQDDYVEVVSPWGNRHHCYEPAPEFGRTTLGVPYVELDVPVGAAAKIARFYDEIFAAPSTVVEDAAGTVAICSAGNRQSLRFRESDRPTPEYDGHHIQIYLANFSGPHDRLGERGLLTMENGQWEYRFQDITDLDTGEVLFTLEHEVRCMTHPLYARPLVNRNVDLAASNFALGDEDATWVSTGS